MASGRSDMGVQVRIGADGSEAIAETRRVGAALDDVGGQAGVAGALVQGMLQGLGQGLVQGDALGKLRQLATHLLDVGGAAEEQRAALNLAAGSAAQGAQAYDELSAVLGGLTGGVTAATDEFIALARLGLDPGAASVLAYRNIATAAGKTTAQFGEAVKKALTDDLSALAEYGIEARTQGEQIAVTVGGQTRLIERDAGSIRAALQSIGEVEFAGAAEAQADTLRGALSALADAWTQLQARAAIDSGTVGTARELTQAVTELTLALAANAQQASPWATYWREMGPLLRAATNPVGDLTAALARQSPTLARVITATADLVLATKGVAPEALAAARATAEYADGTRTAASAVGALTEQQAMLADQVGDLVGGLEAERRAHELAAEAAERHQAALAGIDDAARVLGASRLALETGVSDQDRAILAAFDQIRTSAAATGASIEAALGLALRRISGEQIPLLTAAWDQAAAEGQISSEAYARGVTAILDALDGFAARQPTVGALAGGLRDVARAAGEAGGALVSAVGGADRGLSQVRDRVAELAAALDAFRAGQISAADLGEVSAGRAQFRGGPGQAGTVPGNGTMGRAPRTAGAGSALPPGATGRDGQAVPVQLRVDPASLAQMQALRAEIGAPITVQVVLAPGGPGAGGGGGAVDTSTWVPAGQVPGVQVQGQGPEVRLPAGTRGAGTNSSTPEIDWGREATRSGRGSG